MFLNLFRNAVYAMPNGGTLGIRSENCELDPHEAGKLDLPPGVYIKLAISDTGVGMSPATMERIFEPFYTTKKMGRGTGLGLAASYGIIRNHNGKINVASKMGVGSTFTIYLPALPETITSSPTEGKPTDRIAPGGTETVLLVDNEQAILEIGKEILQELGYTVITAGSGEQALGHYEKNRDNVALVILDMIMPGQSGIETYHALKKINPFLPVMLASGYSLDTQPMLDFLDNWDDFIQKPFHVKSLAQKIRTLLETAAGK
jgi:CheY-like chemotaxis protein